MLTSLSVPYYPQSADGFCLPACAQMVLAYWGIRRSQDRLAKELKTIAGAGTPGSRLLNLTLRKLTVHFGEGAVNDLHSALTHAIPPIILVNTKHFPH